MPPLGPPAHQALLTCSKTHFWIDPQEQLIGILMPQHIHSGMHTVQTDFRTLVYQALMD